MEQTETDHDFDVMGGSYRVDPEKPPVDVFISGLIRSLAKAKSLREGKRPVVQNAKRQATQRFRRINYLAEGGYDAGKIGELIVGKDIAIMDSSQVIKHLDSLKESGVILPADTEPYRLYSIKHLKDRIKVITEGLEAYFGISKNQQ